MSALYNCPGESEIHISSSRRCTWVWEKGCLRNRWEISDYKDFRLLGRLLVCWGRDFSDCPCQSKANRFAYTVRFNWRWDTRIYYHQPRESKPPLRLWDRHFTRLCAEDEVFEDKFGNLLGWKSCTTTEFILTEVCLTNYPCQPCSLLQRQHFWGRDQ